MPDQTSVMEEIAKIRQEQALQGQVLQQIMQNLTLSTQASAQQAMQISTLVTDVTVIKTEFSLLRNEIGNINAWRADSNILFVPRKEHEAAKHEERISRLENAQGMEADKRQSLTEWIVNNGLSMLTFIVMLGLTLFNIFKK